MMFGTDSARCAHIFAREALGGPGVLPATRGGTSYPGTPLGFGIAILRLRPR